MWLTKLFLTTSTELFVPYHLHCHFHCLYWYSDHNTADLVLYYLCHFHCLYWYSNHDMADFVPYYLCHHFHHLYWYSNHEMADTSSLVCFSPICIDAYLFIWPQATTAKTSPPSLLACINTVNPTPLMLLPVCIDMSDTFAPFLFDSHVLIQQIFSTSHLFQPVNCLTSSVWLWWVSFFFPCSRI